MLLRRITQHVREQNWFAVGVDFVSVVVGVFLGILIGNWNEARVFDLLERTLLAELRTEIAEGVELNTAWRAYLDEVANAGSRSIAFIESGSPCEDDCWDRLIDFFHASQYISLDMGSAVFDDMKRLGLPRSSAVDDAASKFFLYGRNVANNLNERPEYRRIVRELIPHTVLAELWDGCHEAFDGIESISRNCSTLHTTDELRAAVDLVRSHPRVKPTLNHWTSINRTMVPFFDDIESLGRSAIAAIDVELGETTRQ
jgi:hypothetical protein